MRRYIAFIVGIGFLHRLVFLGARQLWTDELMQARMIQAASPLEILRRLRGGMDLASPLDFFVQRGFTFLFGDSVWSLRFHGLLFGTLSIWVVYRLSKHLFNERIALFTAVLFAFYPLAFHYSLEARPYALLLFLSLLSYFLLARQVTREVRSWKGWVPVCTLSILLLYANFLGGLILMAQGVGLAVLAAQKRPRGPTRGRDNAAGAFIRPPGPGIADFAAYGATALIALALFYPWIRYEWDRPQLSPASEILNPRLLLGIIKGLGDNSYPVAGLLLIGSAVGAAALWRHGKRDSLVMLMAWFLVPVPALLLVELWAGYFFSIRHLLHVTPPLIILSGYGISHLSSKMSLLDSAPRRLPVPALFFAAFMICAAIWLGQLRALNEPADWRGTATFLTETVRSGDALAMPGVSALLEYYAPHLERYRVDDLDPGAGPTAPAAAKRRLVACYQLLQPAPCGAFEAAASQDPSWTKRQFKGFTVFIRER